MSMNASLADLLARLPELEWQFSKLGTSFSPKGLPRGLFRLQDDEAGSSSYIGEIKADIAALADHNNVHAVRYLALKINQKIAVLVALCAHQKRHSPLKIGPTDLDATFLGTRMERLNDLELTIKMHGEQKEALVKALMQRESLRDSEAQLALQRELGEIEKCLTLAQEAYARAIR